MYDKTYRFYVFLWMFSYIYYFRMASVFSTYSIKSSYLAQLQRYHFFLKEILPIKKIPLSQALLSVFSWIGKA